MLTVTVQDVATYAPDAPAVTSQQVQEALDWAEPRLSAAGVTLTQGSREERAACRAVMLYALSLAGSGTAAALRIASTAPGVLAERKKVGQLETERKYATATETATGHLASAGEYLARAWAALVEAGVPLRRLMAGVSR